MHSWIPHKHRPHTSCPITTHSPCPFPLPARSKHRTKRVAHSLSNKYSKYLSYSNVSRYISFPTRRVANAHKIETKITCRCVKTSFETRMHSSRMRTGRWDTSCNACWDTPPPRDLLQGMLGYLLQCMLGYTSPLETCCKACWDTSRNACWDTPPRDLLQGMLAYLLQCMLGYTPPVNRITHTCKNITLATTLLRPVTIQFYTYPSFTLQGNTQVLQLTQIQ